MHLTVVNVSTTIYFLICFFILDHIIIKLKTKQEVKLLKILSNFTPPKVYISKTRNTRFF